MLDVDADVEADAGRRGETRQNKTRQDTNTWGQYLYGLYSVQQGTQKTSQHVFLTARY